MREQNNPFELEVVSIRLVKNSPIYSDKPITCPQDAVALLGEFMCEFDREVICVINMSNRGIPINCHFASVGIINQAIAHPRELFKSSILSNAASILLIHNHPGGSLSPSKADSVITDKMVQLGDLMEIPLLDHVIVGGNNQEYFSFREKNKMPIPKITLREDYEQIRFTVPFAAEKGRAR